MERRDWMFGLQSVIDALQEMVFDGRKWLAEDGMIVVVAIMAVFSMTIAAGVLVYRERRRAQKTIQTIGDMLQQAMEGDFTEEDFDESRLSALETKFAHYLSVSTISARNVAVEKDRIKTLISDISHQTKTPIANLLLHSELLMEKDLPESASDSVAAIYEQAGQLRFLIDSLVKLSRLENGIVSLRPEEHRIQELFDRMTELFARRAEEKGLRFCVKVAAPLTAKFDLKWTAEALGNVVDNAIKYTERGAITILAVGYEMFVRIDVADTGIGISEEEQAKVFSRFYRSEDVRGQDGVGIGLYLAREIVSNEGGYMKVSSVVGKGAVFSVFLPR